MRRNSSLRSTRTERYEIVYSPKKYRETEGNLLHLLEIANAEVSIVLLDDAEMAAYNLQYRKKQGPTNVLSFPASEEKKAFQCRSTS